MTSEAVKAKLKRYRFVAGEITDLLDELERLRAIAEKITPSMSLAPVHGGSGDKLTSAVTKLIELEAYIDRRCKDLYHARADADRMIDTLTDERHRAVLRCYYFSHRTWQEVADYLHYDIRWVTDLHGVALLILAKSS